MSKKQSPDSISARLDRIENKVDALIESNHNLKTDLEVHKVKSGFWGAFMGALVVIVHKMFGLGAP